MFKAIKKDKSGNSETKGTLAALWSKKAAPKEGSPSENAPDNSAPAPGGEPAGSPAPEHTPAPEPNAPATAGPPPAEPPAAADTAITAAVPDPSPEPAKASAAVAAAVAQPASGSGKVRGGSGHCTRTRPCAAPAGAQFALRCQLFAAPFNSSRCPPLDVFDPQPRRPSHPPRRPLPRPSLLAPPLARAPTRSASVAAPLPRTCGARSSGLLWRSCLLRGSTPLALPKLRWLHKLGSNLHRCTGGPGASRGEEGGRALVQRRKGCVPARTAVQAAVRDTMLFSNARR